MWLPFTCRRLGTWSATQASAQTGNQTKDHLVCRPALNLLSHTSQGYFEFILVHGVSRWSNFNFVHLFVQFSQHYLLNRLSLPPLYVLASLSNINSPYRCGFISLFFSIDLCVCFHASSMLLWLLWPCSILWYQVEWFLQLWSFSRLLWLFRVFYGSI